MVKTKENTIFQIIANTVLIIAVALCVLPFVLLIVGSFTDEATLIVNGYSFFPEKLSLNAYTYLWDKRPQIFSAYGVTALVTALGTLLNITITTLIAYPLSRKDLPGRKAVSFIVFFTMLFNGGLVPTYLMYTGVFGIKNTIWALIVPNLMMSAYYVILVRTFFTNSVPSAIIEAATVDGASELRIFFQIALPLARPIIATVALFVGIAYWNDWYNGMIYITQKHLFSIQHLLNRMMSDIMFLQSSSVGTGVASDIISRTPTTVIRMAIAAVATLPIIVVYPFVQNNFVKGIAIGAVKG